MLIGVNVPNFGPRHLLRLTDEPLPNRRLGEGTVEQVVGDLAGLRADGVRAVVLDPHVGDPAGTRQPEVAWHALAVVRKEFQ